MSNPWDQVSIGVSELNVGAKPFVPNVNAAAFVPSFIKSAPTPQLPAVQTPVVQSPVLSDVLVPTEDIVDDWDNNPVEETKAPDVEDFQDDSKCHEVCDIPSEVAVEEENIVLTDAVGCNLEEEQVESLVEKTRKPAKSFSAPVEPDDKKDTINIIFIGHVDAGKSTIGGQLLFLTGQVDKRTLEKYEREAKEKNRETWYLSWALDTNIEERNKGKTVECGRASFDTESKHFVLLDAPGHKSFVPNMIGGAAQADVAVLVISARKGEFETGFERGGQTREHAMLAKTCGVRFLIVLINKMDDLTVKWDKERYNEIVSKLTPFLKKTGFKASETIYMPCSGFTGLNLKDRLTLEQCPWYQGPSFLEHLDQLPSFKWPYDDPIKVLVSERYKDMGTIVIGKIESGIIRKGDTCTLMPNRNSVKVIGITGADEVEKNICKAGENVKLKLSGIEEDEVVPGFVLCHPDHLCNTARVFDAQIVVLEHKSIICAGYKGVLHIHNAVEEVILVGLIHTIDKKTGEKSAQRPRFIKQDTVAVARFKTANLICMETFANFAPMGRFTLRDEGRTVAMGKVLSLHHKKEETESENK
ncbi:eukaryotic peptide chain release factor GTP-binding subunit ERF3A isoform X2 [Hydra vulgaris]|uniref:Eukaryotic peptide chain release factor GTP-binding subunit ERF3A isoform X2 n=1 Tax=Hydra vulgaris TaxID=6087 RepID=A0ABM4CBT0_HYDVU